MTEDAWLPVLILFFVAPTILMIFRVYIDIARYIRSGYLTSSVVSLAFAVGSYVFFAAACSMVFWRNNRRFPGMEVADTTLGKGPIPQMEALAVPVHEATVMHSYLIPAGLWLCKASFVAMCLYPHACRQKCKADQRQKTLASGDI